MHKRTRTKNGEIAKLRWVPKAASTCDANKELIAPMGERNAGELSKTIELASGERTTLEFIISWYFPNLYPQEGKDYATFYKGLYRSGRLDTFAQKIDDKSLSATIKLNSGSLRSNKLGLRVPADTKIKNIKVSISSTKGKADFVQKKDQLDIALDKTHLFQGDSMEVILNFYKR